MSEEHTDNKPRLFREYLYRSLDTEFKEIRLLVLGESGHSNRISAKLSSANADQCTQYEALSYWWGSSKEKTKIDTSGVRIHVPSNFKGSRKTGWETQRIWEALGDDALSLRRIHHDLGSTWHENSAQWQFKLADLGLSHFDSRNLSLEGLQDRERELKGTRTYGQ